MFSSGLTPSASTKPIWPSEAAKSRKWAPIYKSAEIVLAWLGESLDDTGQGGPLEFQLAFDFFKSLSATALEFSGNNEELLKLEWMASQPELWTETDALGMFPRSFMWRAALRLLDLPYWERCWIFQEVALGNKLLLCTVGLSCDFEHLKGAMSTLSQLGKGLELGSKIKTIRDVRVRQASRDTNYGARWLDSTYGSTLRATHPKDHIYAVL
ncbi:hypothetical protein B0T25DRAFT_581868 [Lasiosphaeria hispida]|uniref:Heterokaryon incompatibility domain-containing protein n=1 Tax=Lasiosphaeria hispida TaxID=260671 RepID=A0AAJ0HDF5_9PEZI|nr:hypothetical protein B0T25DRAFT_581868 [Lasiosphaeria hispida]